MDEELQKKLNEMLVLEQSIQNKKNNYYGDDQDTSDMLKELTESFIRELEK